jgi:hypothetical protein
LRRALKARDEARNREVRMCGALFPAPMASAVLSRRVRKVVGYPPLSEISADQRRELHEALIDAERFEDLPGKWQAAIVKAEQNRPNLQIVDSG